MQERNKLIYLGLFCITATPILAHDDVFAGHFVPREEGDEGLGRDGGGLIDEAGMEGEEAKEGLG